MSESKVTNIKALRKQKKITQEELAKIIGVTKLTILRWENGERVPKADKAKSLADFFGVTVPYLLGYQEETLSFEFPIEENEFNKETQKLIDMADNVEPDSEIYSQVQQIKNMAIQTRNSREKIKSRYGQKVYEELSKKETDFEFHKYLAYLLEKKEYLKSDLLVYISLIDSSDKEIIFKMITEFKRQ